MNNYYNSQFQNLGNICENQFLSGYHGSGEIRGVGTLTGDGRFAGTGSFCGEGDISGYGLFWISGVFNGDVPGYDYEAHLDTGNNLPFITFSGRCDGDCSFENTLYYNSTTHIFSGADSFSIDAGRLTGTLVSGYFQGNGKACGTGQFFVDGHIEASGNLKGTGIYNAKGFFYKGNILNISQACVVCDNNLFASGDFRLSGAYSGNGVYLQTSKNWTGVGGSHSFLVSGNGQYVASGIVSGWSDKLYYGFGVFTGQSIRFSDDNHFIAQQVYGTGSWNGTGYIRSDSGYYIGYGICKGQGNFKGTGIIDSLLGNLNNFYGSGCVSGYGSVFALNTGNSITGTLCVTDDFDSYLKSCHNFPPYLENCGDLGTLAIKIAYTGLCVKYDRDLLGT